MKAEMQARRQFASDNCAGICPEAFAALAEANRGHAAAYGDDAWTARAADMIRDLFETDCEVFFVFNGTAANSLSLAAMGQSYHSILCHEQAHVETGGVRRAGVFFGRQQGGDAAGARTGRSSRTAIGAAVRTRMDVHYPKPRVVSITQATEGGTVYSVKELASGDREGAGVRIADPHGRRAVRQRGGGDGREAKGNHVAGGRGCVVLRRHRRTAWRWAKRWCFSTGNWRGNLITGCKQAGQLASKMRFLSASWVGMLEDGAWLRHAGHANAMAKRLAAALRGVPGLKLVFPCQTNGVFVRMPARLIKALYRRGWKFHTHVRPGRLPADVQLGHDGGGRGRVRGGREKAGGEEMTGGAEADEYFLKNILHFFASGLKMRL